MLSTHIALIPRGSLVGPEEKLGWEGGSVGPPRAAFSPSEVLYQMYADWGRCVTKGDSGSMPFRRAMNGVEETDEATEAALSVPASSLPLASDCIASCARNLVSSSCR